jgi:hypothetical protein
MRQKLGELVAIVAGARIQPVNADRWHFANLTRNHPKGSSAAIAGSATKAIAAPRFGRGNACCRRRKIEPAAR